MLFVKSDVSPKLSDYVKYADFLRFAWRMRIFCLFLQHINVIKIIMDTLTIAFDDRKLLSVIKELVNSMSGVRIVQHTHSDAKQEKQVSVSVNSRYRISPIIKAMETGVSIPDSISDNYKKEIGEIRTQRYL